MATKKKATAKAATKKTAPVKNTAPKKVQKPAAKKMAPAKTAKAPAKKVVKAVAPAKKVAAKKVTAPVKKAAPVAAKAAKSVAKAPVKVAKSAKEVKATPPRKKEIAKPAKPVVVPKISTKSSIKYQPDFTKSVLDKPKEVEKAKSVVRYSDADLKEFKDIILRKLDAAKKEVAYLQGLITRRDEGGDMDEGRYMTMEDGSISMEREQQSQMVSRQINFIDHLEKALMRIENKTYGICRVTGNLIDKARLRAVPHATLSMEAKTMMNK